MQILKGLRGVASYREGGLQCDLKDYDIFRLFSANMFVPNKDLGDGCMQLGWNTVGIFEECAGSLQLKSLSVYRGSNAECNVEVCALFKQVVTRAVNSCTFVYVWLGKYHIMAHLDNYCLGWGVSLISNFISSINLEATGFCSHFYGREENRFAEMLKGLCRKDYFEIYRHRGKDFPAENDDEKKWSDFYFCNAFGHLEIGLSCESNGVVLFGDITNNSCNQEVKNVPSMRFEELKQLMEINLENLNGPVPDENFSLFHYIMRLLRCG